MSIFKIFYNSQETEEVGSSGDACDMFKKCQTES